MNNPTPEQIESWKIQPMTQWFFGQAQRLIQSRRWGLGNGKIGDLKESEGYIKGIKDMAAVADMDIDPPIRKNSEETV